MKLQEKSILLDKGALFKNSKQKAVPAVIDTSKYKLPEIFSRFDYLVSQWPVLITKVQADQLKELSTRLPHLLHQIPELYFNNNIRSIADFYFEGNEKLARVMLLSLQKNIGVSCRLDASLTEDGFKVLEVNTGSSIGGWQLDDFELIVRSSHRVLEKKTDMEGFVYKKIQTAYAKFLVDNICSYVKGIKGEVNLFIVVEEIPIAQKDEFFGRLLKQQLQLKNLIGNTYVGAISLLSDVEGDVCLDDKRIHAVLRMNFESVSLKPKLEKAFLKERIYYPDHLGVSFLGDKRNLAILQELAIKNKLKTKDKELVLRSIPWTVTTKMDSVFYKGELYNLKELLLEYKNDFVIKIANGYKGDEVYLGRFLEREKWNEIVYQNIGKSDFIVQEFSDSADFLAPNISNTWTPHKMIWGVFGFGKEYGGVMTRMADKKASNGVINSAKGAVLGAVYECLMN